MGEQMSFDQMSVEEVLGLIENGEIAVEEAIEIERQGKNRKTLLTTLERLLGVGSEEQQQATYKVTLLKNIKYHGKRYSIGEEIEIDNKDEEAFVKAGIIKG